MKTPDQHSSVKYRCKYPKCKSSYKTGVRVNKHFFNFPYNLKFRQIWSRKCNIPDSINSRNYRICEDHFSENCFLNSAHSRISKFATPIQYEPDPIDITNSATDEVPQPINDIIEISLDEDDDDRDNAIPSLVRIQPKRCKVETVDEIEIGPSGIQLPHSEVITLIELPQELEPHNSKTLTSDEFEVETVEPMSTEKAPIETEPKIITIHCKYPNCSKTTTNPNEFFSFPKPKGLIDEWKRILQCKYLTDTDNLRICGDHFEDSSFTNNLKNALKDCAVPKTPLNSDVVHVDVCDQIKNLHKKLEKGKNRLELLHLLYSKNAFDDIIKKLNQVHLEFIVSKFEKEEVPRKDFTLIGKKKALVLYKKNIKLYMYLQHYFQLPKISVLEQLLIDFRFETGINQQLFTVLREKVFGMNENDRLCTLLFREMPLNVCFDFDFNEDKIYGFEDLGDGRTTNTASKVLVFMLCGVKKQWKQVIAYFFKSSGSQLYKQIVVSVVEKLHKIGVNIMAMITNYSPETVLLRSLLLNDSDKILIDEAEIPFIYSATSLMTSLRNKLLKNTLVYEKLKSLKIDDVKSLLELHQQQTCKLLTKFKMDDFQPSDDFFVAKSQLSHTVASLMETYIVGKLVTTEASDSFEMIDVLDQLFDSLNGSGDANPEKYAKTKPLLQLISPESMHIGFWTEILMKIKDWKFLDNVSGEETEKQFFNAYETTINTFLSFWRSRKFKTLNVRVFSLDPLDNLFEGVKYFYKSPNIRQFTSAIKMHVLLEYPKYKSNETNYFYEENYQQLFNLDVLMSKESRRVINEKLILKEVIGFTYNCKHGKKHDELECCARFILQRVGKVFRQRCRECMEATYATTYSHQGLPSIKLKNSLQCICEALCLFLNKHSLETGIWKKFKEIVIDKYGIEFCETHHMELEILDEAIPFFIVKYLENFAY